MVNLQSVTKATMKQGQAENHVGFEVHTPLLANQLGFPCLLSIFEAQCHLFGLILLCTGLNKCFSPAGAKGSSRDFPVHMELLALKDILKVTLVGVGA